MRLDHQPRSKIPFSIQPVEGLAWEDRAAFVIDTIPQTLTLTPRSRHSQEVSPGASAPYRRYEKRMIRECSEPCPLRISLNSIEIDPSYSDLVIV